MDDPIKRVLDHIGKTYRERISPDSRYYIEVSIGKFAEELGYNDLAETLKDSHAVIPLKEPADGMKVRIDGRTFVDYCMHPTGFALPGYVAKDAGLKCPKYTANDSMILCA